ncbi:unnamed protein product [Durusdinium trenchii]|uniref:Uncharacterized protein n=1 Tax=Durusdinium trenchii TaxID=1381693 RepID=A0ABP0Q5D0_9DINO
MLRTRPRAISTGWSVKTATRAHSSLENCPEGCGLTVLSLSMSMIERPVRSCTGLPVLNHGRLRMMLISLVFLTFVLEARIRQVLHWFHATAVCRRACDLHGASSPCLDWMWSGDPRWKC